METIINANNHFALLAIIFMVAWFGITGDRRNWFKKVSGVLISIAIMGALTSINLIPSAADESISVPVYNGILDYFVALAIPLLLFDVNFKKIRNESGRMIGIFLIGAIGVIIGALIAGTTVTLAHDAIWKLSGVFTGTYIGGSMNLMALASAFNFTHDPLFSSAVAADNIMTNVYLFILMFIPGVKWIMKLFVKWEEEPPKADEKIAVEEKLSTITLTERLLLSVGVSAAIVAVSKLLGHLIAESTGFDLKLDILLITGFTLLLANLFPKLFKPLLSVSFDLGLFLLYSFLAVIGTNSDFSKLFHYAPEVFLMIAIIISFHFAFIMFFGRLLKYSFYEIGLASCANISGPSVCVPLAASYKTKNLVAPAILVGILGYAIGNVAGFFVGWLLR